MHHAIQYRYGDWLGMGDLGAGKLPEGQLPRAGATRPGDQRSPRFERGTPDRQNPAMAPDALDCCHHRRSADTNTKVAIYHRDFERVAPELYWFLTLRSLRAFAEAEGQLLAKTTATLTGLPGSPKILAVLAEAGPAQVCPANWQSVEGNFTTEFFNRFGHIVGIAHRYSTR